MMGVKIAAATGKKMNMLREPTIGDKTWVRMIRPSGTLSLKLTSFWAASTKCSDRDLALGTVLSTGSPKKLATFVAMTWGSKEHSGKVIWHRSAHFSLDFWMYLDWYSWQTGGWSQRPETVGREFLSSIFDL